MCSVSSFIVSKFPWLIFLNFFRYLFGQPVRGHIIFNGLIKCPFAYYCRVQPEMKKRFQLGSDGCATHHIQLTRVTPWAKTLAINATVEEDGTGSKVTASSYVKVWTADSSAQFSIFVRKRQFKPGLPLKGKVWKKFVRLLNYQFLKFFFVTDIG